MDRATTVRDHIWIASLCSRSAVKEAYGFEKDAYFNVPSDVATAYGKQKEIGAAKQAEWTELVRAWRGPG